MVGVADIEFFPLIGVNDTVFFFNHAQEQLWKSDGAAEATTAIDSMVQGDDELQPYAVAEGLPLLLPGDPGDVAAGHGDREAPAVLDLYRELDAVVPPLPQLGDEALPEPRLVEPADRPEAVDDRVEVLDVGRGDRDLGVDALAPQPGRDKAPPGEHHGGVEAPREAGPLVVVVRGEGGADDQLMIGGALDADRHGTGDGDMVIEIGLEVVDYLSGIRFGHAALLLVIRRGGSSTTGSSATMIM